MIFKVIFNLNYYNSTKIISPSYFLKMTILNSNQSFLKQKNLHLNMQEICSSQIFKKDNGIYTTWQLE